MAQTTSILSCCVVGLVRRLRHVQDEKKVAEWMAKQRERDEEAKRKKQLKVKSRRCSLLASAWRFARAENGSGAQLPYL